MSFSIPKENSESEMRDLGQILIHTLESLPHSFKRLEILGQVKKLKTDNFFYSFIKDGAARVEELIIDSILKRNQLQEMVQALAVIIAGPQN